ncbi:MAG: sel1 repeat family protein [Magnetovibrio sp.]|nr:sel1 repeat family protein [Magnetovibrio sp.]
MRLLRPITLLVLFLSLFTLGFPSAWASENLTNDDDWWEKQYEKFDDTDQCSAVTDYLKGLRFYDHHNTTFLAHIFLGGYLRQGTCLKVNIPLAKKVFIFAAERGETTPALLLAQLYFTEEGEEGSNAQEWAKRARLLMITLTTPMRWKQYLFKRFQTSTLSPHLEHAFAWIKEKQNGPVDAVYDIGMDVLKNGTYPESKVVACRWFYNAEIKGHTKASFQLGRQLALGDGVKIASGKAMLLLELSANVDHNVDAYVLAAQLLQEGDVFEKNLPHAYFALLKAQILGADVSEQLKALEPLLTDSERWNANLDATTGPYQLTLSHDPPQFLHPSCSYSSR